MRMMQATTTLLFALLFAACAVPSAPVYEHDGHTYGTTSGIFRQRWWNYYERGTSYAMGGYLKDASRDFRAALIQRNDDRRQARTYGMHHQDYFPNRELGIVLLSQGDYRGAEELLENSLQSEPSERARHFLNSARRLRLKSEDGDVGPPSLEVVESFLGTVTRKATMTIRGRAVDDTFVSSIRVGEEQIRPSLSQSRVGFSVDHPLREGTNRIRVVATDLLGNSTTTEVEILADFHGPQITLTGVIPGSRGIEVSGTVHDLSGVVSLTVAGTMVRLDGEHFTLRLPRGVPGPMPKLVATDRAGNTTEGRVAPVVIGETTSLPVMWAMNGDPPSVPARSSGDGMQIDLYGWEQIENVTTTEIYLQGNVESKAGIVSLTINGEEILHHPGLQAMFGETLPLTVGKNPIVVHAVDRNGHVLEKHLTITRQQRPGREIGSRLRLSCLPLSTANEGDRPLTLAIDSQLHSALIARRRFQLIDRSALKHLLREHHLVAAGLTDPRVPVRLGRLLGAEVVASGALIAFREGLEVTEWLINTATGTILATADGYVPDHDLEAGERMGQTIALALEQALPLVEGRVTDSNGSSVSTDLGKADGLRGETALWLFDPGPEVRHPITGQTLSRKGEVIAEAVIEKVDTHTSQAALLDFRRLEGERPGLRVITK